MKNLIVFFMAVAMFSSVFAQQSSAVYPLNPSSMISVQECIDLMNAAKTAQTKTTEMKKKVEGVVAAVKKGNKTPEDGSKEISKEIKENPEVPLESRKAANEVARKVLYKKDLTEAMEAFETTFKADLARLEEKISGLEERMAKLEESDAKQNERLGNVEEVVADHENRLDNLEEGIFSGYFGAKFLTSSVFDTAGGGELGMTVKIGKLNGPFKADFGATLYGSEIKNLIGIEGRGIITWMSDDFKFVKLGLGGMGGGMFDVNNAGRVSTSYGGGQFEISAVYKRYELYADVNLGARDMRKISGQHETSFYWGVITGVRINFGGPFETVK